MIEVQCAKEVSELALDAVAKLSQILNAITGRCSEEEYEQIKRGVGLSIGKIQMEVLDLIYTNYPELDDLGRK
jgi:hypothetical protein